MRVQDIPAHETEFAVWGPTQSGKDWLYKGFAKELEFYNDNNKQGFRYELRLKRRGEEQFKKVMASPPDISPTTASEDYIHSFHRIPTKDDEAHRISTHVHRINFHNNRGADLVACLMDQSRKRFEDIFRTLIRSKFILITLDPKFEKPDLNNNMLNTDLQEVDYPDIALQPGLSKDQYFQVLSMLLQTLDDSKIAGRYLAVCMTKIDAVKIAGNSAWLLLERIFGQRIHNLFYDYRTRFNMEVFATSAAGFVSKKGEPVPNFQEGKLIDSENWKPLNCATPFFWVFQNSELERIRLNSNFLSRESNLRKYVKYPAPREI